MWAKIGVMHGRANSPHIERREVHSTGKQSSMYFNTWVPCARIGCFSFTLVPFSFTLARPLFSTENFTQQVNSPLYIFNTWVPCARIGCFYFTLVPFSFVDNFSGDGAKFALPVRDTPCCLRYLLPRTTFKTSLRFFHKLLYCVIAVASLPHDTERVRPVVTFDTRLRENPIEFTADFGESLLICVIKDITKAGWTLGRFPSD